MWCCLQASRTEPEDILRMLNAEFPEPETGAALWTLQNDEENLLYVTTGSETALHLNADYVITCTVKR